MENAEWKEKKDFVDELRRQWKLMWMERIDDKVRAEGIAREDFSLLFVERGTVIMATKDYRPLEFSQILVQYDVIGERAVSPSPAVGGWGKFAREFFGKKQNAGSRRREYLKYAPLSSPRKKGGRGWLHARL